MIDLQDRRDCIDQALQAWVDQIEAEATPGLADLKRSIQYSLVRGGKRFRPVLALVIGESFAVAPRRILPWAAAIEMIHSYSLIHDDLPCMDDDDERRGEPTNHRVFGESTALLAGDALLTEAFGVLATAYNDEPALAMGLIRLLVEAAGINGMIGGQALDLVAQAQDLDLENLILMHEMKTGALIRVSAEGAALASGLPADKRLLCRQFGGLLGFAFQLKDDLLDSATEIEKGSMPGRIGLAETERRLLEVTARARVCLHGLGLENSELANLLTMNAERLH